MAKVLGLSFFFHDSAAAIVVDGTVVAAAAEERFSRRKHTSDFPKYAIEYCLDAAGIDALNHLDAIVFYEKPVAKLARILESLVRSWPKGLATFAGHLPHFVSSKLNIQRAIEQALPGYDGEILFSDHHLSHGAAAFCSSPFERAAIITVDGVGESETTTIGYGDASGIHLCQALHFPHSIGLLYSAMTAYLGFRVNDGEWKVMGLAPYGRPSYLDRFRRLVTTRADGSFQLNLPYFVHEYSSRWIANNARWQELFGFPPRTADEPLEERHQDFARSGQALVEELLLGIAAEARRISGCDDLVIGGGVALNSVANWKIEASGLFRDVWVHPAPGDDGGALGAAQAVAHYLHDDPRRAPLTNVYLGPAFDDADVIAYLETQQQPFERLSDDELAEATAALLADGRIVGWCRGRMEFGPRALGNRSILGIASDPEMKARINSRVKFREYFRPFAPSVPLDNVHEYFDVPAGTHLPFMIKVPPVRPGKAAIIPAVTHQDGSARVQTVTFADNPVYYRLLKAVQRRTGIPVIVNTSFNVRGEPVVCTPADAYRCFRQADLDALVIGNCLIRRRDGDSIDAAAGYEASDRLERRIGAEADGSAVDYFRFGTAIDAAASIRKKNPARRLPLHRFLRDRSSARVLVVGAGRRGIANAIARHYPVEVLAESAHGPSRSYGRAIARLSTGNGTARFVASMTDTDLHAFDAICVDDPGVSSLDDTGPDALRRWLKADGCVQIFPGAGGTIPSTRTAEGGT